MNRRRLGLALAVAAVVGVALVLAFRPSGDLAFRPSGDEVPATGRAPTFSAVDLEGQPVRLVDYRGKTVLLNFWASWCIPCRKEFPLLLEVDGKEIAGKEVAVLGVVFEDGRGRAADFMRKQKATWPGLQDPEGKIADAYDVGLRPGLPVTVLIDSEGSFIERHVGELRKEDLDRLIAPPPPAAASGPIPSK